MYRKELKSNKHHQQGIALISAVLIIMIFAIMGMMNAQKAKESERMAGAVVRYDTVFEAAEQSLRDAGDYLLRVDGTPYVGEGNKGRELAANFDISKLDTVNLVMNPDSAIVWGRAALAKSFCGTGNCQAGVDFVSRLDDDNWAALAIQSDFGGTCSATTASSNAVACDNYLRNIRTYTVIERLLSEGVADGNNNVSAMQGNVGLSASGNETYYLITVKASGFPPGIADADKTALNSRENVIIQGVFSRL